MSQKLVEIMVYTRKQKTNSGKSWTKYSTRYNFREDGHEERVAHYVEIKFTEDAFKGSKLSLSDIKRGKLLVDASQIGCPDKWEITTDEKTGKDVYPICWIRGGVEEFTPIAVEHEFHFDTTDIVNEESETPEEVEE